MSDEKPIIRPRPGRAVQPARANGGDDATQVQARSAPADDTLITGRSRDAADDTLVRGGRRAPTLALVLKERPGFSTSLAEQAADLLALAAQLRRMQGAVDTNLLHRQAVRLTERFRKRMAADTQTAATADVASYLVCSLIDETVLNTPWGQNSLWSQNSLLRLFHGETYGGERAFAMIEAAIGAARKDYALLELAYLCLSLGFKGRYRLDAAGEVKLEQLRTELYELLRNSRDRYRQELSPLKPATGVRRRLHSYLSLWVLASVLSLSALGIYLYYLMDLNQRSDQLRADMAALLPPPAPPLSESATTRPEVERLRELLAPEIERGVLRVEEYPTKVSVVLQAELLFPPGSDSIDTSLLPILDKIGKALEIIPGRVLVTGHTDSKAIRTPRFPSNWHLSLARASEVVKYLSSVASLRGRVLPEGRGDSEPIADNDSEAGRARNRRVAIDLYYADE